MYVILEKNQNGYKNLFRIPKISKRENKIIRQERKNIIFHYQAICRKRHAGKNSDTESEKRQVSGARISGLAILWKRRHSQEQVGSWDQYLCSKLPSHIYAL